VIGLTCLYSSVPIEHYHRKLSKNSYTSWPCLCTVHYCWLCCSQNAICVTCRAVKCGLCCPLYIVCRVTGKAWAEGGDSREQRGVFGPKEKAVTGTGGNYLIRSFMNLTPDRIWLGWQNSGEQGMWHIKGSWWMRTGFWYGKKHVEDLVVDGKYY
jgi:hypothetical protein